MANTGRNRIETADVTVMPEQEELTFRCPLGHTFTQSAAKGLPESMRVAICPTDKSLARAVEVGA